jgi:hypothetical protein
MEAEVEDLPLVSDGLTLASLDSAETEGHEVSMALYTAYLGKVNVDAHVQGRRIFLRSTFQVGNVDFVAKVVDAEDYPQIKPTRIYRTEQLMQLRSASIDIDTNRIAYLLGLLAYRAMTTMAQEDDDLAETTRLLSYFSLHSELSKRHRFCTTYCREPRVDLLLRHRLPLHKVKAVYGACCRYNAGVDVLYNTEMYVRYQHERHGWIGVNGVPELVSVVNVPNLDNAFYSPAGNMMYGAGDTMTFPLVGRDVCAHELEHGKTAATCNLAYRQHSGGLNESRGDITACDFDGFMQEANVGNREYRGDANWEIGEDIMRNLSKRKLRSLERPEDGITAQPSVYRGVHWPDVNNLDFDHGGVHITSGVCNHLFYLVATKYRNIARAAQLFEAVFMSFHQHSDFIELRDRLLDADPSLQPCLDQVGLTREAVSDEANPQPPRIPPKKNKPPTECLCCPLHCPKQPSNRLVDSAEVPWTLRIDSGYTV